MFIGYLLWNITVIHAVNNHLPYTRLPINYYGIIINSIRYLQFDHIGTSHTVDSVDCILMPLLDCLLDDRLGEHKELRGILCEQEDEDQCDEGQCIRGHSLSSVDDEPRIGEGTQEVHDL